MFGSGWVAGRFFGGPGGALEHGRGRDHPPTPRVASTVSKRSARDLTAVRLEAFRCYTAADQWAVGEKSFFDGGGLLVDKPGAERLCAWVYP